MGRDLGSGELRAQRNAGGDSGPVMALLQNGTAALHEEESAKGGRQELLRDDGGGSVYRTRRTTSELAPRSTSKSANHPELRQNTSPVEESQRDWYGSHNTGGFTLVKFTRKIHDQSSFDGLPGEAKDAHSSEMSQAGGHAPKDRHWSTTGIATVLTAVEEHTSAVNSPRGETKHVTSAVEVGARGLEEVEEQAVLEEGEIGEPSSLDPDKATGNKDVLLPPGKRRRRSQADVADVPPARLPHADSQDENGCPGQGQANGITTPCCAKVDGARSVPQETTLPECAKGNLLSADKAEAREEIECPGHGRVGGSTSPGCTELDGAGNVADETNLAQGALPNTGSTNEASGMKSLVAAQSIARSTSVETPGACNVQVASNRESGKEPQKAGAPASEPNGDAANSEAQADGEEPGMDDEGESGGEGGAEEGAEESRLPSGDEKSRLSPGRRGKPPDTNGVSKIRNGKLAKKATDVISSVGRRAEETLSEKLALSEGGEAESVAEASTDKLAPAAVAPAVGASQGPQRITSELPTPKAVPAKEGEPQGANVFRSRQKANGMAAPITGGETRGANAVSRDRQTSLLKRPKLLQTKLSFTQSGFRKASAAGKLVSGGEPAPNTSVEAVRHGQTCEEAEAGTGSNHSRKPSESAKEVPSRPHRRKSEETEPRVDTERPGSAREPKKRRLREKQSNDTRRGSEPVSVPRRVAVTRRASAETPMVSDHAERPESPGSPSEPRLRMERETNTPGESEPRRVRRARSDTPSTETVPQTIVRGKEQGAVKGEQRTRQTRSLCVFCKQEGPKPSCQGRMLPLGTRDGASVGAYHWNCMFWCPDVEFEDDELSNVEKAVASYSQSPCAYCDVTGASLRCQFKRCDKSFHFHCGLENNCAFASDFTTYCADHSSEKLVNKRGLFVKTHQNPQASAEQGHSCNLCDGDAIDVNLGPLQSCRLCGKEQHTSCGGPKRRIDGIHSNWTCRECDGCLLCGQVELPNRATPLKCHQCWRSFHHRCVKDSGWLTGRVDIWTCFFCIHCEHCGATSEDPKELPTSLICNRCKGRRRRGNVCPLCSKVYSEDEGGMLCCDGCNKWVHMACEELSIEQFQELSESDNVWHCRVCRGEGDGGRRIGTAKGDRNGAEIPGAAGSERPEPEHDERAQIAARAECKDVGKGDGSDEIRKLTRKAARRRNSEHDERAQSAARAECKDVEKGNTSNEIQKLTPKAARRRRSKPDTAADTASQPRKRPTATVESNAEEADAAIKAVSKRRQDVEAAERGAEGGVEGSATKKPAAASVPRDTGPVGVKALNLSHRLGLAVDLCRVCGSSDAAAEMRYCTLCGEGYHNFCTGHRFDQKSPDDCSSSTRSAFLAGTAGLLSAGADPWACPQCTPSSGSDLPTTRILSYGEPRGDEDPPNDGPHDYDDVELEDVSSWGVDFQGRRTCEMCKVDAEDESLGRLLPFNSSFWIHSSCALWSSEVEEDKEVPGLLVDVPLAVRRAKSLRCSVCGRGGAGIGCELTKCKSTYHFPCIGKGKCATRSEPGGKQGLLYCRDHCKLGAKLPRAAPLKHDRWIAFEASDLTPPQMYREMALVRYGSFALLGRGEIVSASTAFHEEDVLYPVDYRACRRFFSFVRPFTRCLYFMSIAGDLETGPLFCIRCSDDPDFKVVERSARLAWGAVLARVSSWLAPSLSRLDGSSGALGNGTARCSRLEALLAFGLRLEAVRTALESQPGAELCENYRFAYVVRCAAARSSFSSARTEGLLPSRLQRGPTRLQASSQTEDEGVEQQKTETKVTPDAKTKTESASMVLMPTSVNYGRMLRNWKRKTQIRTSDIQGLGLYAVEEFAAGEMVLEYCGELIRTQLSDMREAYYDSKGIGCYMFRLTDELIVDATMTGNYARFINHSCDPNCFSRTLRLRDGVRAIVIQTKRSIKVGEEFTYDYMFNIDDDASKKLPCNCGASNCRLYMN